MQAKRIQLEDPKIVSDSERLIAAHAEMEEAQEKSMLSMRAGLNWKKRKAEIRQDAREKATIVFPRVPVDFSTFSSNADSKSSGSGFISQAAISYPLRRGNRVRTLLIHLRSEPAVRKRDRSWGVMRRVRSYRGRVERGQGSSFAKSENRRDASSPSSSNPLTGSPGNSWTGEQSHPEPSREQLRHDRCARFELS